MARGVVVEINEITRQEDTLKSNFLQRKSSRGTELAS